MSMRFDATASRIVSSTSASLAPAKVGGGAQARRPVGRVPAGAGTEASVAPGAASGVVARGRLPEAESYFRRVCSTFISATMLGLVAALVRSSASSSSSRRIWASDVSTSAMTSA